ncbi:MAG: hypothetical protein QW739_03170 [Candidatus Odinarchaeota archaeon]
MDYVSDDLVGSSFKELERWEALALIDEYIQDEGFKRVLLDEDAQPGFSVAYKDLFEGVYVFPVKLSASILLVISCDRNRFWLKI